MFDEYFVVHGDVLDVVASGVLGNDTDPDDDPLTASLDVPPTHHAGELPFALNANGSFTFEAPLDWAGSDSFTYYANDGQVNSDDAASVTITVTNEEPSAGNVENFYHWIYDTSDEYVDLHNVFMDSDDLDISSNLDRLSYEATVTDGNGAVVSLSVDAAELTLDFGDVAGWAEVTLKATDPVGAFAETTFVVYVVDASTIGVEEQYWDSMAWNETTDSVLWDHNRHRWTVGVNPDATLPITRVDWIAIPWAQRDDFDPFDPEDPFNPGSIFASSDSATAIGNPPPGDYAIRALIHIGTDLVISSPESHKALIKVTAEWTGKDQSDNESNFGTAGALVAGLSGDIIFPEKNVPTGPDHDEVNVTINLDPAMPAEMTDVIRFRVFDPDHWLNDARDPHDIINADGSRNTTPKDNQKGRTKTDDDIWNLGVNVSSTSSIAVTIPPGAASVSKVIRITEPQPGNNWIFAVHDQISILNELTFADDGVTLQHVKTQSTTVVPDENHSEILTAARTLWMELDQMAAPTQSKGPFDGDDDCNNCDDPMTQPALPTVTLLQNLLLDALVWVNVVPQNIDTRDESEFKHYELSQFYQTEAAQVRDAGPSSKEFWVIHTVGAYEASNKADNDADFGDDLDNFPHPVLGYSLPKNGDGENLIYMETIRDIIGDPDNPDHPPHFDDLVPNVEEVVTAHEALHRFFGWHGDHAATDEAIMDGNELAAIRAIGSQTITDRQFRMIQKTNYPH